MPDMFAHYLVAEAAAQRADCDRLLAGAFDAYKVGAQGPDVFFYSRLVRGRRGRPNISYLTHQHQMAAAFRSMLTRAAASPAEERGAAFAFVAGYAAHLCLDAEAHPWVLYWTGDITDGADPTAKTEAFRRHGILEASIDVILTRERSDDTAWLRRQRLLRLPSAQATTAATLLSGMLSDVYDVTLHPHGGTLGLPRHGVGLHDDERSARPADAAARDGRPRGRQGRRRAHPDLPEDPGACGRPPLRRAAPLVLPLAAGRTAHHDVRGHPRDRDGRDGVLPRGDRRRGRPRRGRGRGGGRHRRPEHVHRSGLRRPASRGSPSRPTATSSGETPFRPDQAGAALSASS